MKAKEIKDRGKVIQRLSHYADPWYGYNYTEIYLYEGLYYKISWNDASDQSWWSYERVEPKTVETVEWVKVT